MLGHVLDWNILEENLGGDPNILALKNFWRKKDALFGIFGNHETILLFF